MERNQLEKLSDAELDALIEREKAKLSPDTPAQKPNLLEIPDDELDSLIAQRISDEQNAKMNPILRQAGRLGRMAATGVSSIADIPNLAALPLYAAGLKENPYFYEPISGRVQGKIDELTGGHLKPQSKGEEWADIIGETLASLPAGGAVAKGLQLSGKYGTKVGKAVGAGSKLNKENIAASVGSSVGTKAYLDSKEKSGEHPSMSGALLSGLLGSMAGNRAVGLPKSSMKSLEKGAAKVTGFNPKKYEGLLASHVPFDLADVSDNYSVKQSKEIMRKLPFSGERLQKADEAKFQKLTSNLGLEDGTVNYDMLPTHLAKKGAQGYKDRVSNIYEGRKEKFEPKMVLHRKAKTPVDITDLYKEVTGLESGKVYDQSEPFARFAKDVEKHIKSTQDYNPAILRDKLKQQNYPEPLIHKILENYESESPRKLIPYGQFEKLLRKYQNLKSKSELGSEERGQATFIHGKLRDANHKFIEDLGDRDASRASRQAREFYNRYANESHPDNIKSAVHKIIGEKGDDEAFKALLSSADGQSKRLKAAIGGLKNKEDKRQLTKSLIAKAGQDKNNNFNPVTLHTTLNKLTPSAREALLSGFSKDQQKLFRETINYIGHLKSDIQKVANTSQSGHTVNWWKYVAGLSSAGVALATGNFPYALPIILGAAGTYGGAKLYTNPNFMRRLHKVATAKTPAQKERLTLRLIKSPEIQAVLRQAALNEKQSNAEQN